MLTYLGRQPLRLSGGHLKRDPFEADFLRQEFAGVPSAYYMNQAHWNTVGCDANCEVPEEEIKRMVEDSYDLIKPKARRRNRQCRKKP